MKITVLLRNDHDLVRSLFTKYEKAGSRNQNGKTQLLSDIRREVLLHAQMEEEVLYPALAGTLSSKAEEFMSSAEEEHHALEELLEGMNTQDRNFETKMSQLIDAVNQHIEKVEGEVFDEVRKFLPEFRLEELGLEMEDRRRILVQLAA